MSDWAEYAIGKIRQRQEDQRLKTANFLEQQRIKKTHVIPLWGAVRESVRKHVWELKEKSHSDFLVIQSDRLAEMIVREMGGRLLTIKFDSETCKLSWTCGNDAQGGWEISIDDYGGAAFASAAAGMRIPATADSIATEMLNKLLGI